MKSLWIDRPFSRAHSRTTALLVGACVLIVALLAANFVRASQVDRLNTHITAVYQKSFYETAELMEGLSSNLRKLLVTGSAAQEQILLNEVARQAQGAQDNLASLPLNEEAVSSSIKFVNQVGDFAISLSSRIAGGGAIGDEDYQTLSSLSTTAAEFSISLGALLNRYESGESLFAPGADVPSQDLAPLTNPAGSYPVLLYDGPFSDGATTGEFDALKGQPEVSREEADRLLRAFVGVESVTDVTFTGENSIPIDCYEFSLRANGYSMSAAITRAGGEVLYLLPDDLVSETTLSEQDAIDRARAFLISRGYGEMDMSYYSVYEGILTVNFAATQSGVTLYPDLIKLQVSLRDGTVIGAELGNYLRNHRTRTLTIPEITEEDALSRLSGRLTPQSARLCLIPLNSQEYLCFEVRATSGGDEYLVYIDAQTGVEREIMQVISDQNGVLVM